ncbi:MAG: hypothetical protein ING71_17440 [Rhodocyclaceae bacterium]|nr:hypothetical protein [Rhodocyclaceae bacterium]
MFESKKLTPEQQANREEMMEYIRATAPTKTEAAQMKLDYEAAKKERERRNEFEKTYLAYATAALQGFIASGKIPESEDVFYAADVMAKEHVKSFNAFWKKESKNV